MILDENTLFMRFPSLIRLPKNKQYEIKPRYYDPIKEEIAERTARIKEEMRGELKDRPAGRITFERKTSPLPSAGILQLVIAIILVTLVIGWLYIGNDIIWYILALTPLYLIFRFKNLLRRK